MTAFCGKGKSNPLKVMLKSQKYINKFSEIRDDPDISDEQLEILQIHIWNVYGHKRDRIKPTQI